MRLRGWLERLQASYWFVPGVIALGAIAFALITLALDRRISQESLVASAIFGAAGEPDAARALLSTVAGSLITVAGVVFSVILVALSLASQQYGPRLLDNFMRDRGNQVSLGAFIATFLYCLMVLRVVQSGPTPAGAAGYVPHVSVTAAFALAVANLGVFIYFVHHAAESIQAGTILARVGGQLNRQILALEERPEPDATPGEPAAPAAENGEPFDLPKGFEAGALTLRSRRTGYVQAVAREALVALAREHDAVVRLHHAPGSFVLLGGPLADVYPEDVADDLRGRIESHYALGAGRTPSQDPGFLFDQLLEVAVRALSPGVNDPFTAITCIDRMAEALNLLAGRELPPSVLRDEEGELRLILPTTDVGEITEHLFGELRGYAAGDLMVSRHVATVLRGLQATTADPTLKRVAGEEVRRLLESAEPRLSASDLRTLQRASRRVTAWIRLEEE